MYQPQYGRGMPPHFGPGNPRQGPGMMPGYGQAMRPPPFPGGYPGPHHGRRPAPPQQQRRHHQQSTPAPAPRYGSAGGDAALQQPQQPQQRSNWERIFGSKKSAAPLEGGPTPMGGAPRRGSMPPQAPAPSTARRGSAAPQVAPQAQPVAASKQLSVKEMKQRSAIALEDYKQNFMTPTQQKQLAAQQEWFAQHGAEAHAQARRQSAPAQEAPAVYTSADKAEPKLSPPQRPQQPPNLYSSYQPAPFAAGAGASGAPVDFFPPPDYQMGLLDYQMPETDPRPKDEMIELSMPDGSVQV